MIILLFILVSFLWYVHFVIELVEYMEFIKRYWKELLIGLLVIVVIIESIWIGASIKKNPLAEYKLKEFDNMSKEKDSIANESIKIQRQYFELAERFKDTANYWKNQEKPVIIYKDKLNQEKDEEINRIDSLDDNTVNKLFDSLATEYRLSKKGTPK